jgi:hypothetical protein
MKKNIQLTQKQKETVVLGTPEFQTKYTIVPKLRNLWDYHAKVIDGSELDRLLIEEIVTPSQHNTLERFAAILNRAGYARYSSIDLSGSGHFDPSHAAEKKSKSMLRIVKILEYVDKKAGKKARMDMVNMLTVDSKVQSTDHIKSVVNALEIYFSR